MDPTHPNYICNLHKALYSLKQVPRALFAQLSSWLIDYGFTSSKADTSLFTLNHYGIQIYILLYVDNIVLTSSHSSTIDSLFKDMGHVFLVKDLSKLSYFLRLEVDHGSMGLVLS